MGELTVRYLHYYIQVGHERAGKTLNSDQQKALEVVEELLQRPDFRVEFQPPTRTDVIYQQPMDPPQPHRI